MFTGVMSDQAFVNKCLRQQLNDENAQLPVIVVQPTKPPHLNDETAQSSDCDSSDELRLPM